MRIGDAAKVIQFPPARYGSKQKTEALVRAHISNNVDLIKSIPQQYFDRIEEDIYQNMVSAQRWEVLADKLMETLDYDYGITQSRADLIARDQTSKMNSAFNEDRQTSVGVTSYMWQTSGDERVRPTHADNDGQIFDWDNPPEETGHPGHDVNCLPADSEVQFADGTSKAYRRWFDGELTEIVTESGKTLRATPNHPVLTPRGWLAIGLLHEGDYLIEIADKVVGTGKEYQHDGVTTIRDIFETIEKGGIAQTANLTSADFHGDGVENYVDIVFAARPLTFNSTVSHKHISQRLLSVADQTRLSLSAKAKFFLRALHAAYRSMSSLGESIALVSSQPCHSQQICFAGVTQLNSSATEPVSYHNALDSHAIGNRQDTFSALIGIDDCSNVNVAKIPRATASTGLENLDTTCSKLAGKRVGADRKLFRNFVEAFPFTIQLGRIADVRRINMSGHVFNLETKRGWYAADNIIVHNCRCVALPQFGELEEAV